MGFTTGAKVTADIIDELVDGLIATPGGYWTDNDATWNTSVRTGDDARRSLKYTNGLEELYVALEVINTSTSVKTYSSGGYTYYTNSKGIRITLSASWDSIAHTYPVANQQSFIQFETNPYSITSNSAVVADLSTLQVIYYLWIEDNGFVIMGKPEPTADVNQQSFFLCLERNPNKEYSDGYTNFCVFAWQNKFQSAWDNRPFAKFRSVLRPFAYQYPDTGNSDSNIFSGAGISFWASPDYYAYKSQGNGKVYYVKPIVHNHSGQMMPIMQLDLFFPFSETVGLIDGDVIAIEGATTKYLCKSLDSPDSTIRINMAIKYVA
jgi:hypothetical protein